MLRDVPAGKIDMPLELRKRIWETGQLPKTGPRIAKPAPVVQEVERTIPRQRFHKPRERKERVRDESDYPPVSFPGFGGGFMDSDENLSMSHNSFDQNSVLTDESADRDESAPSSTTTGIALSSVSAVSENSDLVENRSNNVGMIEGSSEPLVNPSHSGDLNSVILKENKDNIQTGDFVNNDGVIVKPAFSKDSASNSKAAKQAVTPMSLLTQILGLSQPQASPTPTRSQSAQSNAEFLQEAIMRFNLGAENDSSISDDVFGKIQLGILKVRKLSANT